MARTMQQLQKKNKTGHLRGTRCSRPPQQNPPPPPPKTPPKDRRPGKSNDGACRAVRLRAIGQLQAHAWPKMAWGRKSLQKGSVHAEKDDFSPGVGPCRVFNSKIERGSEMSKPGRKALPRGIGETTVEKPGTSEQSTSWKFPRPSWVWSEEGHALRENRDWPW